MVVRVFQVMQNPRSVLPAEVQTDASRSAKSAVTTRLFQQKFWKKKKESPSALLLKCPFLCFTESREAQKKVLS